MRMSDWSSDVCSSDLLAIVRATACSPHGVATETVGTAQRWTYGGKFTPVLEVAVRCAPHTTVNGLPSHSNVECKRDDDGRERSKTADRKSTRQNSSP